MGAYRLGGHQHVMEVEHLLGRLAGEEVRVTFTAQVVPACRGILSCLYGTLRDGVSAAAVREAYEAFSTPDEVEAVAKSEFANSDPDGDGFVTGRDLAFGSPSFNAAIFGLR